MKVAVVGSRGKTVDSLGELLPKETHCIISGGAQGIDRCAAHYARTHGLELIEFLPDYSVYGKRAPLIRNMDIIQAADLVLVLWDGVSRGSKFVIEKCGEYGIPLQVKLI